MRSQPDFSEDFEEILEQEKRAAQIDRIETRVCKSDDHHGRDYNIYGWYVPIRPILDEVASKDDFAIESIGMTNDSEPSLNLFVADLRKEPQSHPAFTD